MPENRKKSASGRLDSFFGSQKYKKKERNPQEKSDKIKTTSAQDTHIEMKDDPTSINDVEPSFSEPENAIDDGEESLDYENEDFGADSLAVSEVTDTNCMFLIGTEYNAKTNKARLKFYDLEMQTLVLVDDPTGHEPYLITTSITPETITKMFKKHVTHAETVQLVDLLDNWTAKEFTRAYTVTPSDVPPVRDRLKHAWEAKIRYHLNWICDRQVTPGLTYKINQKNVLPCPALQPIEPSDAEKTAIRQIEETMRKSDLLEKYLPFFLTPIPEIKAAAIDIETDSKEGRIPKPEDPRYAITCICLVDTDGRSWAFCLTDEEKSGSEIEAELGSKDLTVVPFVWKTKSDRDKEEKKLLESFFERFKEYPFIISFNGDLFDFPYLYARAKELKIENIPISYNFRRQMSSFSHAIHIDTYKWYQNPAIRIYAYSGTYSAFDLDTVARALIGKGKIDLEEDIWDLPLSKLVQYCWNDTKITLELLTFDDFTPFKLMMLLARICHMPLEELISSRVSTWLQNLFYYEHRRRNYLIPNQKDIAESKGTVASSKPITEGKQFEGAIVIDPTPGLHFNVKVLDFASLYPSIISTRNLSYETMMCGHPECKTNPQNHIPDTEYYVCSKQRGILAEIIGFLKDIRVYWFKPFSKIKDDPDERKLYSIIEKSLKVLVNASYGVLGAAFFNFFCMSSAESTTAVGRYAIMQAVEKCKELGIVVLYGDTDSVFLANPSDDQIKALIEWSENDLRIGLDVDKAYRYVAFSKRKKNYVGVLTDGAVDIKGLMVKKSNTPPFIQQAFREVMEILTGVETREEFKTARKSIHGIVKECKKRLQDYAYSPEELAISIQMTKTTKSYKVASQHIKAAIQLEEHLRKIRDDNSYYLKPGTIVRFVKTQSSEGVTPVELLKDQKLIDLKAYETQLESTFTQVLDTLGITLFDSQKRARRQFKSLAGSLSDDDLKKKVNIGKVMGRKSKPREQD
ncbi:MAG: DNA-directed DNA polymerase I [Candidatus Hodarchaeota archaeon]